MTPTGKLARVLVVDDERAQMEALCEGLTEQGYEVRGFVDGTEALASLRQAPVDLLLVDLMMPAMDGITFLREALLLEPALGGVIMTGAGSIATAVEAMQTGAFDYIQKPFKLSVVLRVLERAMQVRRLKIENAELARRLRERAAELEASNKELEAFTRTASHDLRVPLNALLGYASLLRAEAEEALPPKQRTWLANVERAARQMVKLLDDLMRLSRLGRQEIELKSIEPAEVVRRVANELLEQAAPGRAIDLQIDPLPAVFADEGLLAQVYANLLSNAFKFTRDVATPRVHVGAGMRDGEAVFFVRDNGVGFDMREAGRLFDPFYRLSGAAEFEGSGVGLSIVHRIVTRHGGRIWVEASPGNGACFLFTLPAHPPAAGTYG